MSSLSAVAFVKTLNTKHLISANCRAAFLNLPPALFYQLFWIPRNCGNKSVSNVDKKNNRLRSISTIFSKLRKSHRTATFAKLYKKHTEMAYLQHLPLLEDGRETGGLQELVESGAAQPSGCRLLISIPPSRSKKCIHDFRW